MHGTSLQAHLRQQNILRATSVPAREQSVKPQAPSIPQYERPLKKQRTAKTLLIDNYDSYTYNLFQLIAKVTGETPIVIQNDELPWRDLSRRLSRGQYSNIVISPGPGTPLSTSDLGICNTLIEEADDTPILGVCLGMQALAHVHGGLVVPAAEPIHGRLSEIRHSGNALFSGIPSGCGNGFEVVRYHSLVVSEDSLPDCLEATGWTCGMHHAVNLSGVSSEASLYSKESEESRHASILMSIAHRSRPHWGVQFHPESVATTHGEDLMRNFFACSDYYIELASQLPGRGNRNPPDISNSERAAVVSFPQKLSDSVVPQLDDAKSTLDVRWRKMEGFLSSCGGAERMFWYLFGGADASDTFWLDSASMEGQRFSYMGGRGGPLWQRLLFNLSEAQASETGPSPGTLSIENAGGERTSMETHFLDFMEGQLRQKKCREHPGELPFEFCGGFVGYLGYEMKAECGAPGIHSSSQPDAAMFFADRLVAIDHLTSDVYLVALHDGASPAKDMANAWLDSTSNSLHDLAAAERVNAGQTLTPGRLDCMQQPLGDESVPGAAQDHTTGGEWQAIDSPYGSLEGRKGRLEYTDDVASCLKALKRGDSYELCLTTQLRRRARIQPREFYSRLRASNPSAHSAWLSFGAELPTICCSSPERFLKGSSDGSVEARPIKGTARRYVSPELDQESKASLMASAKARAENLMIVDLLRNDLGRVCEVGSVHVPGLMEVESYSTVHNLVSTVRGRRKQGSSVVDCLRACFPGGSMTGAPKLRSMQILDRLEKGPRGVYSGCLGFIGLNSTFDLNIIIRTAVVSKDEVTIGAGGAIVLQSDPEDEYEEMMLKASALVRAIDQCTGR